MATAASSLLLRTSHHLRVFPLQATNCLLDWRCDRVVSLPDGFVRRLFPLLVILAFVFGASYACALLFRVMGPWTAVGVQSDGSTTHMAFGPDLPRPDWVPVYPGAVVVQSSRLTSSKM